MKKLTILLLCVAAALTASAAHFEVPLGEVAATLKKAAPGDVIVIKDGSYRDVQLKWTGKGAEGKPVTVCAATPGGVKIGGASNLRMAGEWLTVEGLLFADGHSPSGAVIEMRNGDNVCNDCRLTQCVVDSYNPAKRDTQYGYVMMYGKRNRVDHCTFTGQLNIGVTLTVILNEQRSLDNRHRIDHNWFGNRPVYGSNGAETIRVGTSQQAYESSRTVIEDNYFYHCDGEVEVISIKSSDNVIRRNTLYECQGVLALRHGDRNLVEGNYFYGANLPNTGGVRVVNAGHTIENNFFHDLAGERFFSALALMNAVPNSLPNRYCLVENVTVENNLLRGCRVIEFGTGKDMERTLAPTRVTFKNNVIDNPKAERPYTSLSELEECTFEGNRVRLAVKTAEKGFKDGILASDAKKEAMLYGVERSLTGAQWFDPMKPAPVYASKTIEVAAGEDALVRAVAEASPGDVLVLTSSGGDYSVTKTVGVSCPLTIRAAEGLAAKPVVRFAGRASDNMITILDGGELSVGGIAFCGKPAEGRAGAKSGISTAAGMIKPYLLKVDGCEFYDFGEGNMFCIRGLANTFAQTITIKNCLFRDLSGDAINYADERADIGRYNAENFFIENCAFFRLLGLGVNIYRGGSDESTAGPNVTVSHCTFEDVCNKERGSALRLIGPQVMTVADCSFSNSGRGGASIRFDEATWEKVTVTNCNFHNSGRILTMTGKVVKGPVLDSKPEYSDAARYDFRQRKGSPLAALASDGTNIGIN